jgi:alanine racemase
MSYGYSPIKGRNFGLKPVMTLKSKVLNIKSVPKGSGVSYGHIYKTKKDTYLATIALGYGDGFSRSLSNKFKVTINDKNYPQVGRISMDLTVIEVDDKVKIGDEVIIFGDKSVCACDANDLARMIKTISYEITTSLTGRVERIAVKG